MKRICHMTSAHDSDDVRIFYKECASAAAAGYDTYLVARGESREELGVHVVGVGEAPASRIKRMLQFAGTVYKKALELDADVYHLHDPELLPYGMKLKKRGKKVIFDSHENTLEAIDDKSYLPAVARPLVSWLYRRYAIRIFKKCDALVSVTPHIVDQLKTHNTNTWMITNYPIFTEHKNNQEPHERFTLCFAGGIDPQWSHGVVVKSLEGKENLSYALCGPAPAAYLEELKAMPGWEKVRFYGRVPHEKALEIQKQSDVGMALLQPSKNTGFGIGTIGNTKLFEYFLSGLPVICTNFKLWEDIIAQYSCGICVDPNDFDAIRRAIEHLKQNPEEAVKMGQNGRRAVEQEFNWGTQERVLLELYKSLEQ